MASAYSYTPLSSARTTRIVLLEPHAKHNAVLRCSLEELSLDTPVSERRQYDALSYVWGAKTGTEPLICDNKTILITPNCESALRHLRHARRYVAIWVDAIVIDQANLIERAEQVGLMADIYRGASRVIVWLGRGTTKTIRLFTCMRVACKILKSEWVQQRLDSLHRRVARKVVFLIVGGISIEDIHEVLENDWTTRIWTIQEFTFASTPLVMCGRSKVPWDVFFNFESTFQIELARVGLDPVRIKVCSDRWTTRYLGSMLNQHLATEAKSDGSLSSNLKVALLTICTVLSQMGNCSDPLDKVYALYGLLDGKIERLPSIDYTRNKNELYEDLTRAGIQSTDKFWPARMLRWKTEAASDLPSWVLDFYSSHHLEYGNLQDLLEPNNANVNSTCDSKVSSYPFEDLGRGVLFLHGIDFTKIVASDQRFPGHDAHPRLQIPCLGSWMYSCAENKTSEGPYGQHGGISTAIRETTLAGCPADEVDQFRGEFDHVLKWADRFSALETNPFDTPDSSKIWVDLFNEDKGCRKFWFDLTHLQDSILFLTSSGHIGITTGYIEKGDTIALLAGSDRPVILRQKGDRWRCIGAAYVHGIMNGEAWPSDGHVDSLEPFVLI